MRSAHKYKYLEIQNGIIQFIISLECVKLLHEPTVAQDSLVDKLFNE